MSVDGANGDVVVGGTKHKGSGQRRKLHLKLTGLVVVCLVLLVAAAAGTVVLLYHNHTKQQAAKNATLKPAKTYTEISGPSISQFPSQQELDKQLAAATTDQQKGQIYMDKFMQGVATGGSNKDLLGYIQQAEKLAPTSQTALALAQFNKSLGNKADAVTYYKLYLSRATDDGTLTPDTNARYQQVITDLEKT